MLKVFGYSVTAMLNLQNTSNTTLHCRSINVVYRKRTEESGDDVEAHSPAKRERTSHSSKYCYMCKCRLELAVREIGKCKCGMLFQCFAISGSRSGQQLVCVAYAALCHVFACILSVL